MRFDVSVILLTYNQEKFVSQAINSILFQKFIGSLQIFIFDDCSTDGTPEILNSFESLFPNQIKVIYNRKNIGLAKNFEQAIILSRGKYIAYLEGDDYWTDPNKLQKQFNFLESNSNFVLAFHDFVRIDVEDNIISDKNLFNKSLKRNRSQKDMVTGCLIHQNTMMFRNVVRNFPNSFFKVKNHDTFFIGYLSNWGEAGYVDCTPLHYRIHHNSLWSSLSKKKKHWNGLLTYFYILMTFFPNYF